MSLTIENHQRAAGAGVLTWALIMRLVLFAVFQSLVALLLALSGEPSPWEASAAWWPFTASATSVVTYVFLTWRSRREGFSMASFYRPTRPGVGSDVLLALAVAIVGGALAMGGSILLAPVFFADPLTANELLVRPLPLWAALVALVVLPVTIALTELPLYLGYVQPRLATLSGSAWVAVLLPALMLSLQHATLPLIFEPAFIAWRALEFSAFALLLSWAMWKRPRLLPYLIVVHFLADLATAVSILAVSLG